MGGNALSVPVRRYSAVEYSKLLFQINKILNSLDIKNAIPLSYSDKETYGDLDVLIHADSLKKRNIRELIEMTFHPHQIHHNEHIYSFDYKEFQIDFIIMNPENWTTAYHYYSYNDLGNLIGRISYQMGFRYGHYGLKLVYRHPDGGRKFEQIISKDIYKILDFLGFDVEKYKQGFVNLTDIFDYVIKSKYYNPHIFDYEVLNHQNRTRNKKRVNYTKFLDYIKEHPINILSYVYGDKDMYVKWAEEYFGINIVNQIEEWKKVVELDKQIADKFNGDIIMQAYPNLKGKALGDAITKFKKHIEKNGGDYKTTIANNNVEILLAGFSMINNLESPERIK